MTLNSSYDYNTRSGRGIKVSHGSISNIIHAYKRHEQPSQRSQLPQPSPSSQSPPNNANISTGVDMNNTDGSPLPSRIELATISLKDREQPSNKSDRVTTFTEEGLSEIEFKKNPDISIENHTIKNTQDFEENGYPVKGQKGGPLSWFTNGYGSETKSETSVAQPQQQEEPIANLEDVLEPDDLSLDKVEQEPIPDVVEKSIDEKPVPEAGRTVPGPRSIEDRLKQERDQQWQNYGPTWYRLMDLMKKEKYQRRHEMLVIDRRKGKLEEWRTKLEQREYNLKDRETRVFEAEPFLSVAKQLQNLGIGIEEALPWIETIQEKAEVENIDVKTAAYNLTQELKLYRQFGGLDKSVKQLEGELKMLNISITQKQETLTVLTDLKNRGVTEQQIVQLVGFAGEWSRYWSTTQPPNLQQPGSNGNNGNNGYDGPNRNGDNLSMNDLIKLILLKTTSTNMLNRMGSSG